MKNFQPDFILCAIIIAFLMAFGGGMFLKGITHWWVLLLIAFVLVAIYAEQRAKEDAEEAYNSFMRSDYYDSYEAPEEHRTHTTADIKDITKCSKCGNEVYKICMCNPVKKN